MYKVIDFLVYIFLISVIVFFVNSLGQKKTESIDEKHQANAILAECMETYKESGLSGLIDLSSRNYDRFDDEPTVENLRYAALVDLFSLKIDVSASDTVGFPREKYFASKSFASRVLPRLSSGNKTRSLLRSWIREATEEVYNTTDTP